MTTEDLFSKALEDPAATIELSLPEDDIDTGAISSSSESDSSSSSEADSDEDSDEDSDDDTSNQVADELEDEDEDTNVDGAIRSKHEMEEEPIPELPEDYRIDTNAKITEIGFIKSAFENNIIIHSLGSGERRVLKEGSILCLEDRTVIGTLCEVFGKLDDPFYRVSLPTSRKEQFESLKGRIGEKTFIVIPEAHWVDTFELRKIKGTDASNGYDEELSEDEQEFSDDEKEALFKKLKKEQRKKKNVNTKELREQIEAGDYKKPKQQNIAKQQQHYPKVQPPVGMINHGYRSRNARQEGRTQRPSSVSHFQSHLSPSSNQLPVSQITPKASFQQPMYDKPLPAPIHQPVYYQQPPQAYPHQQYAGQPIQNMNYQGAPAPLYNAPYGQQGGLTIQQPMYGGSPYATQQPQMFQPYNQYGATGFAVAPQGSPGINQIQPNMHQPVQQSVQPNMQQVLQLHSILMQQQNPQQGTNQKKEFNYDD